MSGLVMMLTAWTLSPPTWAAMLPQKFSAATTSIFPLGVVGADASPQPATRSAIAATAKPHGLFIRDRA